MDIEDVEGGLEWMRVEERVIGTTLHKTKDDKLFQVDLKGDEKIRAHLPRYSKSQLTSTKILSQRSAIPAVFSRSTSFSNPKKRKSLLSHEEKSRLLRIGKRPRKGPFNSVMDPAEFGAGSALIELSEAVKESGKYDPWGEQDVQAEQELEGMEKLKRTKVKAPAHPHPRDAIEIPAVLAPHQGTSYNPAADAHRELLLRAHDLEEQRVREAEKHATLKEKMESARREAMEEHWAPGMAIDEGAPAEHHDEGEVDVKEAPTKKIPQRKTQAQRKKAARSLAEKRALAERAHKKRMMAVIPSAKNLRRTNALTMTIREKELTKRRLEMEQKLKQHGLAGQRLGKHKVPEGNVDVQLGEELSESLRALKPEGNLFRDRFLSLQQRALIEPRVPVLPKKHKRKEIEYEKHAWKRFE